MKNIDNIKRYFETTSKEKILKDWDECNQNDVIGVKVDDFIKNNELNNIILNWTKTDEIIYKKPKIKFDSLQEAKTKVIAKL